MIFLSHGSGDKGRIKPIALALIDKGYGLFIDRPEDLGWGIGFCRDHQISFLLGGDFGAQLRAAVRDADVVLGCLSKNMTDDRQVWKEEILVGEHLSKLVLCRIDDVSPADFDAVDTGTLQLERLQSRGLTLPAAQAKADTDAAVVEALLNDAAFSFVLHEIEILAGSSQDQPETQGTAPPDTGPEEDTPSPDPDAPPPRVHIAYRGPTGAAETALPCVIKVMSDLGCDEPLPDLAERNFEQVTAESFDDYLRGSRPVIRLRAENRLGGEDELLPIELHITEMSDFTPAGIALHHPQMSKALEKRGLINRLLTRMDGKPEAEDFLGKLLDDADIMQKIVAASRAQTDFDEEYLEPAEIPIAGEATLHEFLDLMRQLFKPRSDSGAIELKQGLYALCELAYQDPMANCGDVTTTINEMTARIDHVLGQQINEILHHPDFQRVESAWRGLAFLLENTKGPRAPKIRVLNASKREIARHLQKYQGPNFDRCPLVTKIYDDSYGALGGEPPTCLIGDYTFDHRPSDVHQLRNLSYIAAANHAPFLSGLDPVFFQMDGWTELPRPSNLEAITHAPEYAAWQALRDSADSRFLALTCPRFMGRAPYGDLNPEPGFFFEEDLGSGQNDRFCWVNSAYILASNLAQAEMQYGWSARLTGADGGPSVEDLPLVDLPTERGTQSKICPTETAVTLDRCREMTTLGLIPLVYQQNSTKAAFRGAHALHKPPRYVEQQVQRDADAAIQLQRLFPAARLTQHLRCMIRDHAANFATVSEVETWLNGWLTGYVDTDGLPSGDPRLAARPLAAATIQIDQDRLDPRKCLARVYIAPKHQIKGEVTGVPLGFDFTF